MRAPLSSFFSGAVNDQLLECTVIQAQDVPGSNCLRVQKQNTTQPLPDGRWEAPCQVQHLLACLSDASQLEKKTQRSLSSLVG